ncbi:hypothetical protein, partial [Pectobacterium brasiliense]|uniref:hypothetical protein n=1 Tax=Pectobacterium brasiliense TaxID=180957 RepID=UPI001968AFA5
VYVNGSTINPIIPTCITVRTGSYSLRRSGYRLMNVDTIRPDITSVSVYTHNIRPLCVASNTS